MDFFLDSIIIILIIYCLIKNKYIYDKVKNLDKRVVDYVKIDNLNNYNQLEDLIAIYCDLKLETSLPRTRGWAASPDFLRKIIAFTLKEKPKYIIECGSGVTTFVLARCVELNGCGQVLTFDHDYEYAKKTNKILRDNDLHGFATVYHAPLTEYVINENTYKWYSIIKEIESIDLLIVDGPPNNTCINSRYPAGPLLIKKHMKNGVVFFHDTDRLEEGEIVKKWINDYSIECYYKLECEKGAFQLNINTKECEYEK